jgi:hypothetical protein
MRQGQQKRMRGRNRGTGGKGPNPLSRSYESNGPDVKVRGTAAHIAEKYVQLARDAQSSGDPILAEAYLQHAEHYFRVIAAAQPQFSPQQPFGQAQEDEEDGEDFEFDGPIPSMPQVQGGERGQQGEEQPRFQPQPRDRNFDRQGERQSFGDRPPYQDRQPYTDRGDGERPQGGFRGERYQNDRGPRESRPFEGQGGGSRNEGDGDGDRNFNPRHNRRDRRFDRPYQDRDRQGGDRQGPDRQGDRQLQERQGQERQGQERQGQERQPFQDRGERPQQAERPYQPQPQAVPPIDQPQPEIGDDAALNALPSFITGGASGTPAATAAAEGEGEARFPLRSRRRRAPAKRVAGSEEGGEPTASEPGVEPVAE